MLRALLAIGVSWLSVIWKMAYYIKNDIYIYIILASFKMTLNNKTENISPGKCGM